MTSPVLTTYVSALLADATFTYADEVALHEQIAALLDLNGYSFEREVRLSDNRSRIDFLIAGRLGVEVKIKGARADVTRQLIRCRRCSEIEALLLVTTRSSHAGIAKALNDSRVKGCPVFQVSILEGGL